VAVAVMMMAVAKHGHKNDLAVLMNVPVVVVMVADHFLVKVEGLCGGSDADDESQRGNRRKK